MKMKIAICGLMMSTAMAVLVACGPRHTSQVAFEVSGPPPVCEWGYYDYSPYACAPYGYWGPDYFYNGVFIGVGPWFGWGYDHGWGNRRFRGYYRWHNREWGNRNWRNRDDGGRWRHDRARGEWHERERGWVRGERRGAPPRRERGTRRR